MLTVTNNGDQDCIARSVKGLVWSPVYLFERISGMICGTLAIGLTFDPMMLEACTVMLYIAEATVRVRTDPAFLDVIATMTACT